MKKTVPLRKTTLPANLKGCLTAFGLAMFVQFSATAAVVGNPPDTIHSILVSKAQSSKKIKIRLYPDARQQVLFFSANGQDGKVYQLFLFDMDGKLVSQTNIRNRETTVLTNITEGNFLFEVFTDDERIENGQVTVR